MNLLKAITINLILFFKENSDLPSEVDSVWVAFNSMLINGLNWDLYILVIGLAGKEFTCNAGDLGSIPGFCRLPGEGNSYPFQYSGLENSKDCIVHGVAKNWTRLSNFHFHFPWGFPGSSGGKESDCNVGDLDLIPGLGRLLEKGKATPSNILAWRIPRTV